MKCKDPNKYLFVVILCMHDWVLNLSFDIWYYRLCVYRPTIRSPYEVMGLGLGANEYSLLFSIASRGSQVSHMTRTILSCFVELLLSNFDVWYFDYSIKGNITLFLQKMLKKKKKLYITAKFRIKLRHYILINIDSL